MSGLSDAISENAVYVILGVVLFALFFLALNGAMEDGGSDDGAAAPDGDRDPSSNGSVGAGAGTLDDGEEGSDANASGGDAGGTADGESDGGNGSTAATDGVATESDVDVAAVEADLVEGLNRARHDGNASNLTWVRNGALQEMSTYHTDDMVTRDYFALASPGGEEPSDRRDEFDPDCDGGTLAEFVGRANASAGDGVDRNASTVAAPILEGWLDEHGGTLTRQNLSRVAVAAAMHEDDGRIYVTMDLC